MVHCIDNYQWSNTIQTSKYSINHKIEESWSRFFYFTFFISFSFSISLLVGKHSFWDPLAIRFVIGLKAFFKNGMIFSQCYLSIGWKTTK